MKRLYRSRRNRVILGVAGGLAEYFDIDVTIIRIIWVVLGLINPPIGVVGYFICALVVPEMPRTLDQNRPLMDVRPVNGQSLSTSDIDRELEELARQTGTAAPAGTEPTVTHRDHSQNTLLFGVIIAGVGLMLLAHNLFSWINLARLWPALIILVGGLIIWRSLEGRRV